jgi:hypothetical protein
MIKGVEFVVCDKKILSQTTGVVRHVLHKTCKIRYISGIEKIKDVEAGWKYCMVSLRKKKVQAEDGGTQVSEISFSGSGEMF